MPTFVIPSSFGATSLEEVWSDEARAAAITARRMFAKGEPKPGKKNKEEPEEDAEDAEPEEAPEEFIGEEEKARLRAKGVVVPAKKDSTAAKGVLLKDYATSAKDATPVKGAPAKAAKLTPEEREAKRQRVEAKRIAGERAVVARSKAAQAEREKNRKPAAPARLTKVRLRRDRIGPRAGSRPHTTRG